MLHTLPCQPVLRSPAIAKTRTLLASLLLLGLLASLQAQESWTYDWEYGDSLIREGEFEPALAHYHRGLALAKAAGDPAGIFSGYFCLGRGYLGVPDYPLTLAYLDSARSWQEQHVDQPFVQLPQLYYYLGYYYDEMGDYAQAAGYNQVAIAHYHQATPLDSTGLAGAINALGVNQLNMGRNDSARYYLEQALALRRQIGNPVRMGETMLNLGNTWQDQGLWEQARSYYQEALTRFVEAFGPEHYYVAVAYENMGMTYYEEGQYDQALVYLDQSRHLLWRFFGRDSPRLINLYLNLGALHTQMGHPTEARQYLLEAETLVKRHLDPAHPMLSNLYNNLALVISDQADWPLAEHYFTEGRRIWHQQFDEPNMILVELYGGQAQGLWQLGRFAESLAYYRQALATSDAMQASYFHLAPTLYREMADVYLKLGRGDSAYYFARRAIGSQVALPAGVQLPPLPPLREVQQLNELIYGLAEYAQVLTHWAPGGQPDSSAALAHLQLAADLVDSLRLVGDGRFQAQLARSSQPIYALGIRLAWARWTQTGDPAYREAGFRFAEKNKAASLYTALAQSRARAFAGVPDALLAYERSLGQRIGHLRGQIQQAREEGPEADTLDLAHWNQTLLQLFRTKDSLVQHLAQAYPAYYQLRYDTGVPTLAHLQKQLLPGQTLLTYFWADSQAWAWTLTRTEVQWQEISFASGLTDSLDAWVTAFAADLDPATAWPAFVRQGHYLYQQLLGPVLPPDGDRDHLVIIPDGPLGQLPFALLLTAPADDGQQGRYGALPYVLQEQAVSYVYSARLWQGQPPRQAGRGYGGFAPVYGPDIDTQASLRSLEDGTASFGPLRYNQPEVQAVAQLLGGDAFTDAAATEGTFKDRASQYALLHLAMHAYTHPSSPDYSGMIFTLPAMADSAVPLPGLELLGEDGVLHAYEIYGLHLPAHLAVLSACNTGIGQQVEGEGVMSLARAFAYAGCRSLMPTLWPVDDAATRELMEPFFAAIQAGVRPSQALRQSQLAYAQRFPQAHPRYWGAFVVVGEDAPLREPGRPWLLILLGGLVLLAGLGWWAWRRQAA